MKKIIIKKLRHMVKYYRENGPVRFVRHLFVKLLGLEEMSYKRWRRKHRLTKKIQKQQREEKFKVEPVFSIIFTGIDRVGQKSNLFTLGIMFF